MGLGEVLCEPSAKLNYIYFPTTAIVSLLYVLDGGASTEIAVVSNEGILALPINFGMKNLIAIKK